MPSRARKQLAGRITRSLIWFHRWLGVATCLIFALWFASGAVLLFQPFPSLPKTVQMELQQPISLADIHLAPSEAMAVLKGKSSSLRLLQFGSVPAYLIASQSGTAIVDANSGARLAPLNLAQAQTIARQTFGKDAVVNPARDYDQWTVHNRFDPLRPLYRIDLADQEGTQFYLSAQTGELVQRTTVHERGWNWVGAVLHWVYFTPVRSSFALWDNGVWVVSLVAMLVALAGTVLGVIQTLAAQRQRKRSFSFYRLFWMRWHHITGLFVGLFVMTWIFSGWLSMDHGRLFDRGQPTATQAAHYHGLPFGEALASFDVPLIQALRQATEVRFDVVGATPLMIATRSDASVQPFDRNGAAISPNGLLNFVTTGVVAAWPDAKVSKIGPVSPTEVHALAEGWPANTKRVTLQGSTALPDIYVNGTDGSLLTVMSDSRAAYSWVYFALHTFKFPGLVTRPWLREIIVLIPLIVGFLFSITGVILGFKRICKSMHTN